MGSRWRKAKLTLGLNLCVYVPRTLDDVSPSAPSPSDVSSDALLLPSPVDSTPSDDLTLSALMPTTPTPSSSGLRLSKSGSRSSKKTCAICLGTMKAGQGHALFTAECSHTFHFHCIASNVKHGNHNCPVCRTKWKELPFRGPHLSDPHNARINNNWPQDDGGGQMNILRRLPRAASSNRLLHQQHHLPFSSLLPDLDPSLFNDDEPLDSDPSPIARSDSEKHASSQTVQIKTFTEFSQVSRSGMLDAFTVLIHLKAPLALSLVHSSRTEGDSGINARAPVDLITVLDVSGSMAGTKLALLKRAMGFVIQNLGPTDRLSVVSFSSTARRLFPLRRISDSGRQQSLLAVNSLTSNGGTNIAEGLRKGVKVIEERKEKNPVCTIILLSDGQDTYTVTPTTSLHHSQPDYTVLLPASARRGGSQPVPVHVFGFGADHDSAALHSISESSGGTFSFIETESAIQDAFAQCIGGILSVVAQQMHVQLESTNPSVELGLIKSGSYSNRLADDKRNGSIEVGDLYADEERDFLVSVNIPPGGGSEEETSLLKVGCTYRDPVTKEVVSPIKVDVKIQRPVVGPSQQVTSVEVDRQWNRIKAAEAMVGARSAAESGDLAEAVSVLEQCRTSIARSVSGNAGDRLCTALDAELKEMQERMVDRQRYEASGRAYMLSGLSSHSWQRATARGDSTESTSLVQAYQTPSMVDMVLRSQTMSTSGNSTTSSSPAPNRRSTPQMRHARSFPARPQPR